MFVKRKYEADYSETETLPENLIKKRKHLENKENFIIKFHKNINLNELDEKVLNFFALSLYLYFKSILFKFIQVRTNQHFVKGFRKRERH